MKILNMLGVEAISYVDEENNSAGATVYDVVEGKSTVYLIEGREFARIEGSCTQTGGESGGKATAQREHMGRRLPACVIVPAA